VKSSRLALGVVSLVLVGLWYFAGGAQPLPVARATDDGPRVADPHTHANLAVYFIHGGDAVADAKVLTLQEALECNLAVVHETGTVNTLAVENLSPDHELFVQSGDLVKGGKQDRMVRTDVLLPPRSGRVPLSAHCVEQGRWTNRGSEDARQFASSAHRAVGKEMKLANHGGRQAEVWQSVAGNQGKLTAQLSTRVNADQSPTSFQLTLEAPQLEARVKEYEAALAAAGASPGDIIGAVLVVNGQVTSADVYGTNVLFRKAWPKLLNAAAVEAVRDRTDGAATAPPSARAIERYLARADDPEPEPQPTGEQPSHILRNANVFAGFYGNPFSMAASDPNPAAANRRPGRPAERVSIQFDKTPWDEVLDWYAQRTGLTLITTVGLTGSLTLTPSGDRRFTISEVTDLLNEALAQQNLILVRRTQTFFIHPIDEKIDPTQTPRIDVSELAHRGKTEIVQVILTVDGLVVADVIDELRKLLTPFGWMVALDRPNLLLVQDTVGNIERIRGTRGCAHGGNGPPDSLDVVCEWRPAGQIAETLKVLLTDRDGRLRSVRISVDTSRNAILMTASQDRIAVARNLIKQQDTKPSPDAKPYRPAPPEVRTYDVPAGAAETFARQIRTEYPWIQVTPLAQQNQIVVVASPDDHSLFRRGLGGRSAAGEPAVGRLTLHDPTRTTRPLPTGGVAGTTFGTTAPAVQSMADGNLLRSTRAENSGNLVVESRDPNRKNAIIHKSYVKK
jgi:hypothetical protein